MAPSNSVRIRLRYVDLDSFVERFAPNVTRGGVFLASRNVRPVDSVIQFEIQLAGGDVVLAGSGRVTWVKEFNAAEPNRPFGMGVQFVSVDAATKPILARLLRAKDAAGTKRRPTLPLQPLGTGTASTPASGSSAAAAAGSALGATNGSVASPRVDTSVDLAAEFGLSDAVIRRMIDRSWRAGGRDGDLEDLLRREPVESTTLEQALAELPRLLDPQHSRRRATGSFRAVEAVVSVAAPSQRPLAAGERMKSVVDIDDERISPMTDDDEGDLPDASDRTDMTGVGDASQTMEAVLAEPAHAAHSNGRPK